ncbi:MAG TPA: glycerophosphodiester phosphodiesterase family protein [Mycobacteriales bacterium]|nr:glycerophosphodiester phosphodiesterase family protein [Mycobacteriales bacterium]
MTGGGGGRPFVYAHRGSSEVVAEHTLGAYLRAIDEGADGLECDVRLTRDGHLVCVHDRRIDRTSTGRGVVSDFDLADLGEYDFGSWRDSGPGGYIEDRDLPHGQVPVLTLERLLEAVLATPRPIRLLVETKHPTRYAGLVEQQLVRLLRRYGLTGPADPDRSSVTVMSFAPLGLRRIRLLAPGLPTVLLFDRVPLPRRDGSLPTGVGTAGPGIHIVRAHPRFVTRVQRRGHQVYVWTVNEPEDVDLVLGLGVDGIITNRPAAVLAQVRTTGAA